MSEIRLASAVKRMILALRQRGATKVGLLTEDRTRVLKNLVMYLIFGLVI